MIYLVGLWANVLPGLLLLLLVGHLAERSQPGYGAATAVILGLGTLTLPLSTLMFSHVFTRLPRLRGVCADVARARGAAEPLVLWRGGACARLCRRLGVSRSSSSRWCSGLYLLSRRDSFTPLGVFKRAGAFVLGGLIGIVPLLLYNHYAFHSWTHLAYSTSPASSKGSSGSGARASGAGHLAARLARALDDLARAGDGGRRHLAALQARPPRRGAHDHRRVRLLPGLQLRLLPAVRRRLHGTALFDDDDPVPGAADRDRAEALPGPTIALAGVSLTTTIIATDHPSADRL